MIISGVGELLFWHPVAISSPLRGARWSRGAIARCNGLKSETHLSRQAFRNLTRCLRVGAIRRKPRADRA